MRTIAKNMSKATEDLAEIVSMSEEGNKISEDPSTIIAASNKETKEAYKDYLDFKEKHSKEIRAINKIQVELGNSSKEMIEVRKEVSRNNFFHPNNAIRPGHLNEDANLVDIKSWIIDFPNYIISGYNVEVPKRGHYTQMRPILDKSLALSLDSLEPNEVDLETLCNMLMDEGKSRMPLHHESYKSSKEKHGES